MGETRTEPIVQSEKLRLAKDKGVMTDVSPSVPPSVETHYKPEALYSKCLKDLNEHEMINFAQLLPYTNQILGNQF